MKDNQENKKKQTGKTGLIPNDQMSGSDADKAYDKDGNFEKKSSTDENKTTEGESPKGSEAAPAED